MDPDDRALPVVESGATQPGVVEGEGERLHQVEGATGVGAEPHDAPGIGSDLGLVEDDAEKQGSELWVVGYGLWVMGHGHGLWVLGGGVGDEKEAGY